ncbi:MAG: hypothetical protein IJ228_06640 [Succinivibrio sp.]|nr:hypothetical protein [Succinivibrio sp.]
MTEQRVITYADQAIFQYPLGDAPDFVSLSAENDSEMEKPTTDGTFDLVIQKIIIPVEEQISDTALLKALDDKHKDFLLSQIRAFSPRTGDHSRFEESLLALFEEFSTEAVLNWLGEWYAQYSKNSDFICELLVTLGHLDYDEVPQWGRFLALSGLAHLKWEVESCAIEAFAAWHAQDTLESLKNHPPAISWLRPKYQAVIDHLKNC